MKKKVRRKCFEDNSSSMHSVVVTADDSVVTPEELTASYSDPHFCDDSLYLRKDGTLDIYETETYYGRAPFKVLWTFEEKLKYALSEWFGGVDPSDPEWEEYTDMFISIIEEAAPQVTDVKFLDMSDYDIYIDQDGNELPFHSLEYKGLDPETHQPIYTYKDKEGVERQAVLSDETYWAPRFGTIDHQSMGLLKGFLKYEGISLKDFLLHRKYKIVIDGDEYCVWEGLKRIGLINTDNIVDEFDHAGDDPEYFEWLKEQRDYEENS